MADTLMYLKRLEEAGFSRKQAEAQVEIMRDHSSETYATKADLKEAKAELKQEISEFRRDALNEFKLVRQEMAQTGDRITIRLGGLMVIGMTLLAAFLKLS